MRRILESPDGKIFEYTPTNFGAARAVFEAIDGLVRDLIDPSNPGLKSRDDSASPEFIDSVLESMLRQVASLYEKNRNYNKISLGDVKKFFTELEYKSLGHSEHIDNFFKNVNSIIDKVDSDLKDVIDLRDKQNGACNFPGILGLNGIVVIM